MPEHTYRVRLCLTCGRRRRVYWTGTRHDLRGTPARFRVYRCSQGHVWEEEIGTLERISEVTRDLLAPVIAQHLLADSPFFTTLRRR